MQPHQLINQIGETYASNVDLRIQERKKNNRLTDIIKIISLHAKYIDKNIWADINMRKTKYHITYEQENEFRLKFTKKQAVIGKKTKIIHEKNNLCDMLCSELCDKYPHIDQKKKDFNFVCEKCGEMELDCFFYLHSPEESNLRNLLEKFLGTSQEFSKKVNITNKINILTSGSLYSLKLQLNEANKNMSNCISIIEDWDEKNHQVEVHNVSDELIFGKSPKEILQEKLLTCEREMFQIQNKITKYTLNLSEIESICSFFSNVPIGQLWYEVATNGRLLYQKDTNASENIDYQREKLRDSIQNLANTYEEKKDEVSLETLSILRFFDVIPEECKWWDAVEKGVFSQGIKTEYMLRFGTGIQKKITTFVDGSLMILEKTLERSKLVLKSRTLDRFLSSNSYAQESISDPELLSQEALDAYVGTIAIDNDIREQIRYMSHYIEISRLDEYQIVQIMSFFEILPIGCRWKQVSNPNEEFTDEITGETSKELSKFLAAKFKNAKNEGIARLDLASYNALKLQDLNLTKKSYIKVDGETNIAEISESKGYYSSLEKKIDFYQKVFKYRKNDKSLNFLIFLYNIPDLYLLIQVADFSRRELIMISIVEIGLLHQNLAISSFQSAKQELLIVYELGLLLLNILKDTWAPDHLGFTFDFWERCKTQTVDPMFNRTLWDYLAILYYNSFEKSTLPHITNMISHFQSVSNTDFETYEVSLEDISNRVNKLALQMPKNKQYDVHRNLINESRIRIDKYQKELETCKIDFSQVTQYCYCIFDSLLFHVN